MMDYSTDRWRKIICVCECMIGFYKILLYNISLKSFDKKTPGQSAMMWGQTKPRVT